MAQAQEDEETEQGLTLRWEGRDGVWSIFQSRLCSVPDRLLQARKVGELEVAAHFLGSI